MPKSSDSRFIIFILIVLAVTLGLLVTQKKALSSESTSALGTNVTTINGKQIIDLTAKGGYSPATVNAKANIDTILRVKTNSTFDCSSVITVPSLGIRENLPPTATTDIPLPAQAPGTQLAGTCAMGMYNFMINYQ